MLHEYFPHRIADNGTLVQFRIRRKTSCRLGFRTHSLCSASNYSELSEGHHLYHPASERALVPKYHRRIATRIYTYRFAIAPGQAYALGSDVFCSEPDIVLHCALSVPSDTEMSEHVRVYEPPGAWPLYTAEKDCCRYRCRLQIGPEQPREKPSLHRRS